MTDNSSLKWYYAHSLEGKTLEYWEILEDHLINVATLSEKFSSKWHAGSWGYITGLWHDLGKYSEEFQSYLKSQNGLEASIEQQSQVDHSTAGAQHAKAVLENIEGLKGAGIIIAYCIASHHSGLLDYNDDHSQSCLIHRFSKDIPSFKNAPEEYLNDVLNNKKLSFNPKYPIRSTFQISIFCRMLFSSLVDADFLSTESFMSPERSVQRPAGVDSIESLSSTLTIYLKNLASSAEKTEVNRQRQEILSSCLNAAELSPGLFSLTVPTGGGKTLASLAFALKHAHKYGMERVIFAIPFTSIVEQTVEQYRDVFQESSKETILEHHSNLDPEKETFTSRLACENWDAPIVVTTNVQLFESLFANRTSKCRKLHRIANSVIILDEAQTIPVNLLEPTLAALRELASGYNCSIVLCTATQPAIIHRDEFKIGLKNVREIIPDPKTLYQNMKRVSVEVLGKMDNKQLADNINKNDRALCIVNSRQHAAELYQALRNKSGNLDDVIHLSASMCPAHRSQVITKIKTRLKEKKKCKVISTQLVEAGVDLDFPFVFRSLAGIDSIAQAAGRCNREGILKQGQVYIFEPTEYNIPSEIKLQGNKSQELIGNYDDILGLEAVEQYFRLYYWQRKQDWDKEGIMELLSSPKLRFQFKEAAEKYQIIKSLTSPVIIPFEEEGKELLSAITGDFPPDWRIQRKLQRYIVSIYRPQWELLMDQNAIHLYHDQYPVLIQQSFYNNELGLLAEGNEDPAGYVV